MAMVRRAILLALSLFMIASAEATTVDSLSDLQWKKRIILVANPEQKSDIINTLNRFHDDIEERDIAWFVVVGDNLESNMTDLGPALSQAVHDRLVTATDQQQVVLIGKDGGIKDRSSQLNLERLFAMIDSMPMRIREMREGN